MTETIDLVNRAGVLTAQDPFMGSVFSLGTAEPWVGFVFGGLFLLIGLACFFFVPRARRNADSYKAKQLEEFNKQYRRVETNYDRTGMYLPLGEKMKLQAPVIVGVMFILVGITWMVGTPLTTL